MITQQFLKFPPKLQVYNYLYKFFYVNLSRKLVHHLAQLAEKLKDAFSKVTSGSGEKDRYKFCIGVAQKVMPLALSQMFSFQMRQRLAALVCVDGEVRGWVRGTVYQVHMCAHMQLERRKLGIEYAQ